MGTGVGDRTLQISPAWEGHASPPHALHRGWSSWPLWLAVAFTLMFVATTVAVATGVTQPLDTRAIHALRPGDQWGPWQLRLAPWMSRLRPQHMYIALAGTSLLMSAWRRSLWPTVFGGLLAATSGGLTVLAKVALHRPDPHGYLTSTGGSYPSGHIIAVVACLGGCLLVVWPRVHWWLWVPVVTAAALMSASLLTAAAHWPTDVLGGVFLALSLVSAGSRLPWRARAHGTHNGPRQKPRPKAVTR